jgi:hypothetical protein
MPEWRCQRKFHVAGVSFLDADVQECLSRIPMIADNADELVGYRYLNRTDELVELNISSCLGAFHGAVSLCLHI